MFLNINQNQLILKVNTDESRDLWIVEWIEIRWKKLWIIWPYWEMTVVKENSQKSIYLSRASLLAPFFSSSTSYFTSSCHDSRRKLQWGCALFSFPIGFSIFILFFFLALFLSDIFLGAAINSSPLDPNSLVLILSRLKRSRLVSSGISVAYIGKAFNGYFPHEERFKVFSQLLLK